MPEPRENLVVCPHCDRITDIGVYPRNHECLCPQCQNALRPKIVRPEVQLASMAFAGLIFLVCSILPPFMSIAAMGLESKISLLDLFIYLQTDWAALLWVFLIVTFVAPTLALWQIVCIGWFKCRPGRLFAATYQFCHHFSMVDVFVLGIAVSLVKLSSMANVDFYPGFYCSIVFSAILLWCMVHCPAKRVWDMYMRSAIRTTRIGVSAISEGILVCRNCSFAFNSQSESVACPRCLHQVHARNSQWAQKTLAFLFAALALYLPANLYPIMYTTYLGDTTGSNIVQGAITIWNMGSYGVSLVIIVASLLIPSFKIIMLFLLVYFVKSEHLRPSCRALSLSYHAVEFIGKWSMVDVFVVILMSAIVQMGTIISIFPGFAVICFCAVVLITIYAAENFDERLIWDKLNHV